MAEEGPGPSEAFSVDSGDGGDGGGSSSSGSSAASAAAAAAAEAKAEQERIKEAKQAFRGVLRRYRVPAGPFGRLIDRAAKEEWNQDDFIYEVSKDRDFRRMFPGIGTLFKQSESFATAISTWRQSAAAYKDTHATLDIPMKLNKRRVGLLIKNNVSPAEYAQRLLVAEDIQATEATRQAFNQVRAAQGLPPWDEQRWKMLMTTNDRKLWDQYEAAKLMAAGFRLSAQEALQIAQVAGNAGELLPTLSETIAKVKAYRTAIGQELDQQGITDADLLSLEVGADPRGIAPQLDRIVKAREALGTTRGIAVGTRGPTGVPVVIGPPQRGL